MFDLSNYSCDKCAREFSRHCKHCRHTTDKPPTRFKPKKTIGIQTPEFRKPTPPPPPLTSGSNAVKPNPNYVPPASVKKPCPYELPCGWCTKWDKKCDKKIGGKTDSPQRGLRTNVVTYDDAMDLALKDIISGKGLSHLDANLDPNKPLPSGIRKEIRG